MGFENSIFCALDTTDTNKAVALTRMLKGMVGGVKLGLEFFYANGPQGYHMVAETGVPVFLDLKLHDIPNTVAGGIRAILPLKPAIVNVHGSGGLAMMQLAAEAARESDTPPLVIAVTVLTSLDQSDLAATGVTSMPADQVRRIAQLAARAGLDGVVCSAHEIAMLRREMDPGFKLIVPGLRPASSEHGDQKRVMTPAEAQALGADILVIGRPITGERDPTQAVREIVASLRPASVRI